MDKQARVVTNRHGQRFLLFTRPLNEVIPQRLADLEARHGMTSAEFLDRYERGELDLTGDFIDWHAYLFSQAIAEQVK